MRFRCAECGGVYGKQSQADYCAKADLDPRLENRLLRSGLIGLNWITKPEVPATDTTSPVPLAELEPDQVGEPG